MNSLSVSFLCWLFSIYMHLFEFHHCNANLELHNIISQVTLYAVREKQKKEQLQRPREQEPMKSSGLDSRIN